MITLAGLHSDIDSTLASIECIIKQVNQDLADADQAIGYRYIPVSKAEKFTLCQDYVEALLNHPKEKREWLQDMFTKYLNEMEQAYDIDQAD